MPMKVLPSAIGAFAFGKNVSVADIPFEEGSSKNALVAATTGSHFRARLKYASCSLPMLAETSKTKANTTCCSEVGVSAAAHVSSTGSPPVVPGWNPVEMFPTALLIAEGVPDDDVVPLPELAPPDPAPEPAAEPSLAALLSSFSMVS